MKKFLLQPMVAVSRCWRLIDEVAAIVRSEWYLLSISARTVPLTAGAGVARRLTATGEKLVVVGVENVVTARDAAGLVKYIWLISSATISCDVLTRPTRRLAYSRLFRPYVMLVVLPTA